MTAGVRGPRAGVRLGTSRVGARFAKPRAGARVWLGLVLAAAALVLAGCGAVWTYDGAMRLNREHHGARFQPPDSVVSVSYTHLRAHET